MPPREWFSLRSESWPGSRKAKVPDMLHEQLDGQLRLVQLDPLQGQTFSVRKRDGHVIPCDETRIQLAIEAASRPTPDFITTNPCRLPHILKLIRIANAVIHVAIARAVKGDTLEN
jgi:hypothetical protein